MIQISHKGHVGNAIAWLLLGVVGGLFLDLCAKEILRTYSLLQFVLVRSLIALAILLAIAPRVGGLGSLRTNKKAWHLLRSVLGIGAMSGFFYGLSVMPLINALTLGYTAPLMMTALSAVFLGDQVEWRRWGAVSVGFIGVLIMLRPGRGEISLAAIAVLIAAFCYACQAITARKLTATKSTLSLSLSWHRDCSSFTATLPSASETNSHYSEETKKAGHCPPFPNMIGQRVIQLTSPAWRPATCHDLTCNALTTLSKKSCSSTLTLASARNTSANACTVSAR